MTPAQHYTEAQQLLDDAAEGDYSVEVQQQFVAIAAVHAQLALVGVLTLDALTAQKHRGNPLVAAVLNAVSK